MSPVGLGIWVAYPGAVEGGDWGRRAERLAENPALQWIALRSGGTHRAISSAELEKWIALARGAGAKLLTWHYSYPADVDAQAEHVGSLLAEGVDGHVIDAEAEWERALARRDTTADAQALGAAIRDIAGADHYIAHAPLAIMRYHSSFPYGAFAGFCDAVHPQAYWTEIGWSMPATCNKVDIDFGAFNADFPAIARPICPIGVTYGHGSSYGNPPGLLSSGDVQGFAARYRARPAASFYSWEAAGAAFWAGLSASVPHARPAPRLVTARDIQAALTLIARYRHDPLLDPLGVDNVWGPRSQRALEAFEHWEGLPVGGPITDATRALLSAAVQAIPA